MSILCIFQMDYTLRIVSIGSLLLGIVSGIIGSFAVLRKQGLLGDAISHASLPGIAIVFIVMQTKNTFLFMLGALLAGLIAAGLIVLIDRYTRIKIDSAMALVLSVFFGFGLMLLTYIQKIPNANQAGLEKFIFGQASTLLKRDIYIIAVLGGLLLLLVAVFWKEIKVVSFDSDYADSIGISSRYMSILLSSMTVVSIIIGLQTVGVILMSAMLVAPGVAARQWTNRLSMMIFLAGVFGGVSGIVGTLISSSIGKMPTGPAIVIVISIIVIISIVFAPNRGLLWKKIRDYRNKKEIGEDSILINLYLLALNHKHSQHSHPIDTINPLAFKSKSDIKRLENTLKELAQEGYVVQEYFDHWAITEKGVNYVKCHPLIRKELINDSAN